MNKDEATKYILQQLCEWYYTLNPSKRVDDKNDLSVLKVLKLIFFLCTIEKDDKYLLDDPFNNFFAMPLGPVETDVYDYLVRHTEMIDFKKTYSKNIKEPLLDQLDRDKIDYYITELKKINYDLINKSAFYLVDLTHEWTCWIEKYKYAENHGKNSERMVLDDIKNAESKCYTF